MTARRFSAALVLCLVLAAGLRFLGIAHGWPRNYIADTTVVRAALSIGAGANPFAGAVLPTQYPYFLPYLLSLIYGALFVLGSLVGMFGNLRAFEQYAFANPEVFFLIASGVVAAFGCAQVVLVALVARRLLGDAAACLAALFTATSLILVQLSHQPRPHIVAAALILGTLYFALRHQEDGRPRALWLAWVSAALATSTAPYGVLSAAIALLGSVRWTPVGDHLGGGARVRGRRVSAAIDLAGTLRRMLLGIAVFAATVIVFYPRFILGDPVAYDSASGVMRSYGGLYLATKFINGKGFSQLLVWLLLYEPVLTTLAALGVVIALSRRRWQARWALVTVFPLLYLVVYGSYEVIHPRYLVPLIAFLSFPAGWLAARLQSGLSRRVAAAWGARFRAPTAIGFVAIVFLLPVAQALRLDLLLMRDDTRDLAERWIRENLRGSRLIAAEAHGVELPLDERSLRWMATQHPDQLGLKDRHRLRLAEGTALADGFPVLRLWSLDGYRNKAVNELQLAFHTRDERRATAPQSGEPRATNDAQRIEHVVVVRPGDRERADPFYLSVAREGRLLLRVTPLPAHVRFAETQLPLELQRPLWDLWKVERCGPIVEIYELGRE